MRTGFTSVARMGPVLAVLLLVVASPGHATDSESPSFRLSPVALDAAGPPAASASSAVSSSLAQEMTVGASSSVHFVVQSGFWSFLGSTMVPNLLSVSQTPGDPDSVDLSWSGNQASYDIYRSTDCAALLANPFAATSANDYTDASPPESPLVCYGVFGEAPGP